MQTPARMLAVIFAALTAVTSFGSNPGALSMYKYVPPGLPANRPLVVVLHGCTQTAAAMEAAGWNQLADQYQFAVLYPEQSTANNPVRCFNWAGEYGDTANLTRGQGENQSIISMIDTMHTAHGTDNSKVFIAGFSAGGAFVPVMLATWPERFAAAAIMEGIPYRCATSVNGAYSCQSPGSNKTAQEWGNLVRAAHTFTGPRPRVQIWHGTSDSIVVPLNGTELVEQFTDLAGTDTTADETEMIGSAATRTAYKVGSQVVVEFYSVQNLGHAVAVGAEGMTSCPASTAAYFESRGICSTLRAAKFFGLTGGGSGTNPGGAADPTVAIVSPANGDTVTGALTVVVAAGDDTGIASVDLAIDGASVGSDMMAPYQFAWDATAAGPGSHTLVATAIDLDGNDATSTTMVTVPGPGGGSGSNGDTGGDDDGAGPGDLPACTLDAGHHRGVAPGWLLIALAALVTLRRRR